MPCAGQKTFDLKPTTQQLKFDMHPEKFGRWSSLPLLDGQEVREALMDVSAMAEGIDIAEAVLPVVFGDPHELIENGNSYCLMPEVAHMPKESLFPASSNQVLQRFIKRHANDCRAANKGGKVPYECDDHSGLYLPAWARSKRFVDSLEKTVRMEAAEHVPALSMLHEGEERMADANTRMFMTCGVAPLEEDAPPEFVRSSSYLSSLYSDFLAARESASCVSPYALAAAGLIPDHVLQDGECPMATAQYVSPNGFDSWSEGDLSAEDVEDVYRLISLRMGRPYYHEERMSANASQAAEELWDRMRSIGAVAPARTGALTSQQSRPVHRLLPASGPGIRTIRMVPMVARIGRG